jgi:hypothetical protein
MVFLEWFAVYGRDESGEEALETQVAEEAYRDVED